VTGAALRMTWPHFFVAGAALYTYGMEKSQNALARGRQLCTQLSSFEGQNCFVFDVVSFEIEVPRYCFASDVVKFKK